MRSSYKIRTAFIFFIFSLLYGLVVFNLYLIQIRRRDFYTDLGTKQYKTTHISHPPRAYIYDRSGTALAINHHSLSAFVLPKKLKNKTAMTTFLKQYFPEAAQRLKAADKHFMYVKRRLSPQQAELINKSGLEDLQILKEPSRYYPFECAAQIVGVTNIDNEGICGIEHIYNECLTGKPTECALERDARSGHAYFKRKLNIQGKDGDPVVTTLDSDLQFLAFEELKKTVDRFKAQEGSVLIMDPANGDILTMATYPTFNPNNTASIDLEHMKNKIITDAYEPGSVIKVFLALAALEENVVTADELIDCENTKEGKINGARFGTWRADGKLSFSDVIVYSNNIGTAKVALRLNEKLYDHYKAVGFGKKTEIAWPGEQSGFVNAPKNWSRPSIVSLSFGYEIRATLLQLARAFGLIANNGCPVKPRIILNTEKLDNKKGEPLYSANTINIMRKILKRTITKGTAYRAKIKGYNVMGKTGTANLIVDGKYSSDHNIYTFSGIVEKNEYKRVIVTFVKDSRQKNLFASQVAAPLFEKVAEKMLIHDKII